MSSYEMTVEFELWGLSFQAVVNVTPEVPAYVSGLPEDCYPAEGGELEFLILTCQDSNADFLLNSTLEDELMSAAYEACIEQVKSEAEFYP